MARGGAIILFLFLFFLCFEITGTAGMNTGAISAYYNTEDASAAFGVDNSSAFSELYTEPADPGTSNGIELIIEGLPAVINSIVDIIYPPSAYNFYYSLLSLICVDALNVTISTALTAAQSFIVYYTLWCAISGRGDAMGV